VVVAAVFSCTHGSLVAGPTGDGPAKGALVFRFLRAAARGLTYPARVARRRPRLTLVLLGVVLVAAALAGFWHVQHQWGAAQAALAADRPGEARSRLDLCLLVWPHNSEVHLLAARAARLSGDAQAAEAHLNQCLKLNGEATEAVQLEFLLLRVQTGDLEAVASPLIDCVEKGHPDSPLILETLARAYIHLLRYKPAYACLSRWIELRPDEAKAYQWRGWVLERLSRYKVAMEDYQRALELNPDLFPVRLRVAEMLLEDKQAPEALPHLERLYRQAPDNPEVQARLGMCRFLQNQTEDARRLMEAAVVHLPNDASLLISLAKLDLQEGHGAEAEQRLRKVLQADPSDTEALYSLASALQLQSRSDESAAVLKEYERYKDQVDRANKLLQEVADSPTARAADFVELGELLLRIGRERLGVYWLEQALEREPDHPAAHTALADYYEKKGDQDKATAHRRWLRGDDKVTR
jgi:tetratricopeptide (TPR) repeat protein